MEKTSKLINKRIRITKKKKVLHRKAQLGHFKSKDDPNTRRKKRKNKKSQSPTIKRAVKEYTGKL
ncbi:MAG: hypothetical protein AB1721_02170 [Patescibacteria group bacterium]